MVHQWSREQKKSESEVAQQCKQQINQSEIDNIKAKKEQNFYRGSPLTAPWISKAKSSDRE